MIVSVRDVAIGVMSTVNKIFCRIAYLFCRDRLNPAEQASEEYW